MIITVERGLVGPPWAIAPWQIEWPELPLGCMGAELMDTLNGTCYSEGGIFCVGGGERELPPKLKVQSFPHHEVV